MLKKMLVKHMLVSLGLIFLVKELNRPTSDFLLHDTPHLNKQEGIELELYALDSTTGYKIRDEKESIFLI